MNTQLQELNQNQTQQIVGGKGQISTTLAAPIAPIDYLVPKDSIDALRRHFIEPQFGITQGRFENGGGFEFLA